MHPQIAHIMGVPVEEMLAVFAPVAVVSLGALTMTSRSRWRRITEALSARFGKGRPQHATTAQPSQQPPAKIPPSGSAQAAGDDKCPKEPYERMPKRILAVAIAWLFVLTASFVLFERWDWFTDAVQFKLGPLPFETIWFGAIGGLLISLQGIFKHNRCWLRSYDYWHMLRPVLGAIMGTLGCLIFVVLTEAATKQPSAANPVFYDVIALALGYREESFRTLLARLLDTIILPPEKEPEKAPAQGDQGQAAQPKTTA